MIKTSNAIMANEKFFLDKWFLDFVGSNGETMIFYAAKLTWHGITVPYTSWLNYNPISGVNLKSRFRNINMPIKKENEITWVDDKFKIDGSWVATSKPIKSKIYESKEGALSWNCYQPSSDVQLKINNQIINGKGYAEQLILTVPPWDIPMDELRWGRFGSNSDHIVWIELRKESNRQWLWHNGDKMENCTIENDYISIPERTIVLKLDQTVVLESEKKIFSVVNKLSRFLPGFNRIMPLKFILADEQKWLSNGRLLKDGNEVVDGKSIHEWVNFRASSQ